MSKSLEQIQGWQPIETAPKDGTYIIVYIDAIYIAFWNGNTWDDGDWNNDIGEPTHWMPLPKPPAK